MEKVSKRICDSQADYDNDGMKQHMLFLKNRTESAAATDLAEVD